MTQVYTRGFDAHTHLDSSAFDDDRDAVVARARGAGVDGWVVVGSTPSLWDKTAAVAAETGGVAIYGIHPWDTAHWTREQLDPHLADLHQRPMAGLGEIGLDALHTPDDACRTRQRTAMREQLAIARQRDLPVAFHGVRAWPELLKILVDDGLPRAGGMVHAWSGPPELIDRAIALGLHVSFGPLVLNPRAKKARNSVARVPERWLLLETDCPDGKPHGEARGEPAHLLEVAKEVAKLRDVAPQQLLQACGDRGRALFRT